MCNDERADRAISRLSMSSIYVTMKELIELYLEYIHELNIILCNDEKADWAISRIYPWAQYM